MLRHLTIRNLAVIDALDLALDAGFTVLTGETGAGKSILIDAVGLVLGMRADVALVRPDTAQAEVIVEFDLSADAAAHGWLEDHALTDGDEPLHCTLRRVVQASGRTRAFVNDRPVSASALRELGERLVEIFGQGESRTLVHADVQRDLLDAAGTHADALRVTAAAATECQHIEAEIRALREACQHEPAQLDFLRFQLAELEALNLEDDEPTRLDAEHRRLANAGRLLQDGAAARDALYGDDGGLYDRLAAVTSSLEQLAVMHDGFSEIALTSAAAQEQLREAAIGLRTLLDRLDLDPERLRVVETRMTAIHDLARKHRIHASELPARRDVLARQLAQLENVSEQIEALESRAEQARRRYLAAAADLTAGRRASAQTLATAVGSRIRKLGLSTAEFPIAIEPRPPAPPSVHGEDIVRFDFTANPGQPPRPLAKVASGGELSRIALALQVTARQSNAATTMIFDEVDAGIGGEVAEIVGAELKSLGADRQVLCVTHLAQVAAQGDHHLHIRKHVDNGQTYTRVQTLDRQGRVDELARMAGGRKVGRATQAHARALLEGEQRR